MMGIIVAVSQGLWACVHRSRPSRLNYVFICRNVATVVNPLRQITRCINVLLM